MAMMAVTATAGRAVVVMVMVVVMMLATCTRRSEGKSGRRRNGETAVRSMSHPLSVVSWINYSVLRALFLAACPDFKKVVSGLTTLRPTCLYENLSFQGDCCRCACPPPSGRLGLQ